MNNLTLSIAVIAIVASPAGAVTLTSPQPAQPTLAQLQGERTLSSPRLPAPRSREAIGGDSTSRREPQGRVLPYRWAPGAEIIDNRDLGLGLVQPDPLTNEPLIGEPDPNSLGSGLTDGQR